MPAFVPKKPKSPDFIELMNALGSAYKAVAIYDAALHRESGTGLTPAQADVILTLGGTEGMTCADVGAETLITKGTLTGVIDRLRAKGLVERWADAYDARRTLVALTAKGEATYKSLYPRHVAALQARFDALPAADRKRAAKLLRNLAQAFTQPQEAPTS